MTISLCLSSYIIQSICLSMMIVSLTLLFNVVTLFLFSIKLLIHVTGAVDRVKLCRVNDFNERTILPQPGKL